MNQEAQRRKIELLDPWFEPMSQLPAVIQRDGPATWNRSEGTLRVWQAQRIGGRPATSEALVASPRGILTL